MPEWVIYGRGGHAKAIADAIEADGSKVVGYFDDQPASLTSKYVPVLSYSPQEFEHVQLVIGIGRNDIRKKIAERVSHAFGIVIHPKAIVAADVYIGEGTVILAGAVVQPGAVIGRHVIINANATVDHDAQIGDFCHIYPNAYIGGEARIGDRVTIEACSVVKRQAIIPDQTSNP